MTKKSGDNVALRIISGQSTGEGEIVYPLSLAGKTYNIFFRSQTAMYQGVETAVLLALLPAMRLGLDLLPAGSVSREFAVNIDRFMDLFSGWFPGFRKIRIYWEIDSAQKLPKRHVAGFFTAGVDSFYTLLKHQEEITHIVYVHGFDVSPGDHAKRKAVSDACKAVAETFGKELVEVETNARRVLKGYTEWGKHAHGVALGAVAHVLSPVFEKIYIGSSFYSDLLFPWGSHPEIDPLLSGSNVSLVHDSCEVRRTEKIEFISHSPVVMDHLRVCYENVEGTYNCGKCEKCMRTMISLYALGKLQNCGVFPDSIDPSAVRGILFKSQPKRGFMAENLALMEARGLKGSPVYSALKEAADRSILLTNLFSFFRRRLRKLGLIARG